MADVWKIKLPHFALVWSALLLVVSGEGGNVRGAEVVAERLKFWPPPGFYTNFVGVAVHPSGGRVRYTIDGSEPGKTSSYAFHPIQLRSNAVVTANAFNSNQEPVGASESGRYRIVSEAVGTFESQLPLIVVNSLGAQIKVRDRIPAQVMVIPPTNGAASLISAAEYSGPAAVAIRGNSSSAHPKKAPSY